MKICFRTIVFINQVSQVISERKMIFVFWWFDRWFFLYSLSTTKKVIWNFHLSAISKELRVINFLKLARAKFSHCLINPSMWYLHFHSRSFITFSIAGRITTIDSFLNDFGFGICNATKLIKPSYRKNSYYSFLTHLRLCRIFVIEVFRLLILLTRLI